MEIDKKGFGRVGIWTFLSRVFHRPKGESKFQGRHGELPWLYRARFVGGLVQKRSKFRQAEASHGRLRVVVWRQKS
jgi:hypothetical protein